MTKMPGMIDFHSHFLPGVDDGAQNTEQALQIINRLESFGFDTLIATPHFYFYNETCEEFLNRRNSAFQSLRNVTSAEILLSAEVAYRRGLSEQKGIEKLVIPGTEYLLIELPAVRCAEEVSEESYELKLKYGIKPLFAHFERYLKVFKKEDYDTLLSVEGSVFQMNIFSFSDFSSKKIFKRMYRLGADIVVGSDAHKCDFRIDSVEKSLEKLKRIVGESEYKNILSGKAVGL